MAQYPSGKGECLQNIYACVRLTPVPPAEKKFDFLIFVLNRINLYSDINLHSLQRIGTV